MAEVSLYVRVRINGKQQYIKPVWQDRKNLKPLWGFVAGQATHCPNGVYHLRYVKLGKRVWEHVGTSALTAASARETREWQLNNTDLAINARFAEPEPAPVAKPTRPARQSDRARTAPRHP